MKQKKFRYFENDETFGPIYDWGLLRREFRKLKTPEGLWDPTEADWEHAAYIMALSTRSGGKTTQAVLFGMVFRAIYGIQIGLVRIHEEQIMPKAINQMLDTIRSFDGGRYVKQITEGRWNDVKHSTKDRAFYYCNRDENGDIYETEDEPFLKMFALTAYQEYKSGLNAPRMDLVIFDEFIELVNDDIQVSMLFQWLSTIFRFRVSTHLVMLANTIRVNSIWFRELEIAKELRVMKVGEQKILTAKKGTKIWVHLFDTPEKKKRLISSWMFGFANPKVAAIIGGENVWELPMVQHIQSSDDDVYLSKSLKIDTGFELLGVDFVRTPDRGIVVNIHPVTRFREGDIVLTNGDIWDTQHRKGRGYGRLPELLQELEKRGKIYYSDAETAADYVSFCATADGKFI